MLMKPCQPGDQLIPIMKEISDTLYRYDFYTQNCRLKLHNPLYSDDDLNAANGILDSAPIEEKVGSFHWRQAFLIAGKTVDIKEIPSDLKQILFPLIVKEKVARQNSRQNKGLRSKQEFDDEIQFQKDLVTKVYDRLLEVSSPEVKKLIYEALNECLSKTNSPLLACFLIPNLIDRISKEFSLLDKLEKEAAAATQSSSHIALQKHKMSMFKPLLLLRAYSSSSPTLSHLRKKLQDILNEI